MKWSDELIFAAIITICITALFISILIDFLLYNDKESIKCEKHSFVATGSMSIFYIADFILMRFGVGRISEISDGFFRVQLTAGTLMIGAGTIINILGRIQLKDNWANHIKIYMNHTLITKGVYGFVRHPLYASIMLMLYGGAFVYSNGLSFVLVTFVFIPAMYYRAKQEEKLLLEEFSEYEAYKKQVGLFFPKRLRRYKGE